jgi:intracellular septation protein
MNAKQPGWLKPLIDFGPLVGFFVAFKLWGVLTATAFLIALTSGLTILAFVVTRKLAVMPVVTLAMVLVFGGLALWLQDETFIKMKPTFVMAVFAVALFIGLALDKPLVKYVMQSALTMNDKGWRALTWRFAWFCVGVGLANEIVWRTQPTDVWVNFKVFGIVALNFLFVLSQIPLIRRHQQSA